MLSIGNKKYRNLQEQVGYNTECIKKLDEYLDGISIQDKLVVIANDSGTFTEEEIETLSMPLAFIADASKVWIKESETSTELIYKAVDIAAKEIGSAYFKIGGSKIVIDKNSRNYVVSDDDIILTYSKDQLDSLLSLKANLSGANFTGAVTAPTLKQANPNYSLNFNMVGQSNIIATQIYNRFLEVNNILYCISNIKLTNDTASDIVFYNGGILAQAVVTLAPEIASKLYTMEGNTVADIPTSSQVGVATERTNYSSSMHFTTFPNSDIMFFILHPQVANVIYVGMRTVNQLTVPAGSSIYITARIALTLI